MSGNLTRIALLSLCLAVVAPANAGVNAGVNAITLDEPAPVGTFSLRDHRGEAFTQDSLRGQWTLVLVGYTSCPDVCPYTLANLQAVVEEAGLHLRPDDVPRVVLLAVDPERDAPALADYVGHFGPRIVGVTGKRREIDVFVEGVDGAYRFGKRTAESDHYEVKHSATVALVSPRGELFAKLNPPFALAETASYLAHTIRRFKQSAPQ